MNPFPNPHPDEAHKSHRAPWLRAAVLGMNDGVVSTASLMLGVFAASDSPHVVVTAGVAGLVAGALSMAAGEYVSVSSQRDSELSDIAIEEKSLAENPEEELKELAWIYQRRGLTPELAQEVAKQLHDHDAITAHARTELNIDHETIAKPGLAAFASATAFAIGAIVPIVAAMLATKENGLWVITTASFLALITSGAVSAYIGGGRTLIAAFRVFTGGALAMGITYFIGHLIGASV